MSAPPRRLPVGPNPARPCDGCPRRPGCSTPCAALSALLPTDASTPDEEVLSPALTRGEVYTEPFTVAHAALTEPEAPLEWPRLWRRYTPRLRALVARRGTLTPAQRAVVRGLLDGLSRGDVGARRGIARQNVHKSYRKALERLRALLAPPSPSRGDQHPKGRRAA